MVCLEEQDLMTASRFGTLISDLAIKAVKTVCIVKPDGRKDTDRVT